MTSNARQTTPRPILQAVEPQLCVADMQRSCDFYTGKLGFAVAFVYGDPPSYAQVVRDNARLNLKLTSEQVLAGDIRRVEHLLAASITVASATDIQQLYAEFQVAGVRFEQEIEDEEWGATTFIVADPDENLVLFAGPSAG